MFLVTVKGKDLKELASNLKKMSDVYNGQRIETTRVEKVAEEPVNTPDPIVAEETVATPVSTPVVEAPVAVTTSTSGELDSEGLPWNSRIHSSNRQQKSDGTWRLRRGVDKDVVASVRAELKNLPRERVGEAPVVPATPTPVPPVAPAPVETPVQPVPPVTQPTPVTTAPVAAPAIPAPTQQQGHTLETFKANYPLILGNLITEGKVTPDYIAALKQYFNVTEIWDLNDDQKAEMFNTWSAGGIIQRVG